MIDAARRDALAAEYLAAWDTARLLPTLPSARGTPFTLDDAFAVSDRIRALRVARGETPVGWKIGFTNRSIWDRYGVHAPIWGPVWDTTTTWLDGTRAQVDLAPLCQPRLEPEIVFGLARVPEAGMDLDALAGCIDWVAHGFEIVHTHLQGWRFAAADCQADFALHGRLFVGPRVPVRAFADPAEELAALRLELLEDGRVVDRGEGRVVLGGPLHALRRWVDAMAVQRPRWAIRAGDIVTTGTITDAWPLRPGVVCTSRIADARLPGLELATLG